MSNITAFQTADATEARLRRRRRMERLPLAAVVEQALPLLRLALEELPDRGRVNRQVRAQIGMAADDLEMALEVNADTAARQLSELVIAALGPGLTVAEVAGGRKALQLLLDCLPEIGRDPG